MKDRICKGTLLLSVILLCMGMTAVAQAEDVELLSAMYPTSEPTFWTTTPALTSLPAGSFNIDHVDVGDPTSESSHGMAGIVCSACSGGDCSAYEWGGVCSWLSGRTIRAMWEQGPSGTTDPSATMTLDFGSLEVNKYVAVLWNRGAGDDSFDIDIDGDVGGPYHVSWIAGGPESNNVCITGVFDVGIQTGVRTVTFTATASAWSGQTTYAQAMISEVAVWSDPECVTGPDCDDDNVCTDDACVDYVCEYTNNTAACDDDVYCNGTDTCGEGTCSVHAGDPCGGDICWEDNSTCYPVPPLILNEFNAVGGSKWLDCDGLECSDAEDSYFGRVEGNGGNWIELVVIEDHLNIQGWTIAWSEDQDTGTITFTNDSLWSDLRAGTIITLTESCETEGGMDTDTDFHTITDWWININTLCGGVAQETYVTTTHSSDPNGSFSVGNNDFQVTISDNSGKAVAFGPAGEGVCDFDGVSSREVGKLEQDPSAGITPCSDYNDGTSSTFGEPNVWGGGNERQSFSDLRGTIVDVELIPVSTASASDTVGFRICQGANYGEPCTIDDDCDDYAGVPDSGICLPELGSLPTGLSQVDVGEDFVVEMWVRTSDSRGLTGAYTDIQFDQDLVTPGDITHTFVFDELGESQGTASGGLIDCLGGTHEDLSGSCSHQFAQSPGWARVAYVDFTATAHGSVEFQSANTQSSYDMAICGSLGLVDMDRVVYGDFTLQTGTATGELVLDVPTAPQIVATGQTVTVDLKVANLSTAINGVQALMHYNIQNLTLTSIDLVAPWDTVVSQQDSSGDIAYTVGIAAGSTDTDGTVATLTFTAVADSTPVVSFLPDHPESYPTLTTKLTQAAQGQAVMPSTTDSSDGDLIILDNECLIAGQSYDAGDPNPQNECEECDPSQSLTDWTPVASGTACGDSPGVCENQDTCDGSGSCVDNGFKDPSTVCRASAGLCDVAEMCDGASADCPADAFEPDTTECRVAVGDCDVAEYCTGDAAACPTDEMRPDTYECRASAGDCDVADFCDGVSANCPADEYAPDTTECRAAVGDCDAAEFCPGNGADCPADDVQPDTYECRVSAGLCDVAEYCDGSTKDCPTDAFEPDTIECRVAVGNCDVAEYCTGDAAACPTDEMRPDTYECRAAAGDCDVADFCDGVSANCPADGYAPDTTECRAAVGDCDAAEFCPGNGPDCPLDDVQPDTYECRVSAGFCDIAEYCDGSTKDCPMDAFEPDTIECRVAVGDCDVAEYCTGDAAACPADEMRPDTYECRAAAGDCDVADFCDGVSAYCPADEYAPDTTECRAAVGDCDAAEFCPGNGTDCPADDVQPDTYVCRTPTDLCDAAEYCDGVSINCPADGYAPDTTECRPAVGDCDMAEFCPGDGVACPADAVQPDTYECRVAAGFCDIAEYCDGSTKECPIDAFEPDTTECRVADGDCDVADFCDGVSANCPADGYAPDTTECRAAVGDCDAAEFCTGNGPDCPSDNVQPDTYVCRSSADLCDAAEYCDGVSVNCPVDGYAPDTTECRPAVGDCDVAEFCPGDGIACPADDVQPNTYECRTSAGLCDVSEYCDGTAKECPSDEFEPDTTECRGAVGDCDIAEFCPGNAAACPDDGVRPDTYQCRGSSDLCDAAEYCDGSTKECPTDGFEPDTTECRPAVGDCDVAEFCPGDGVTCPADAVQPDTYECRTSAGLCDVSEYCDGSAKECPTDEFEPDTTECRGAVGDCDVAEFCPGDAAACPADDVQPDTHECRGSAGPCDIAENCDGNTKDCPLDGFEPDTIECRGAVGDCDVAEFCSGNAAACPADEHMLVGTPCDADGDLCTDPDQCDGDGNCVAGPATAHIYVNLNVEALGAAVTRDVTFNIDGVGSVTQPVEFAADGSAYVDLNDVSYLNADWICASEGHTLPRDLDLTGSWGTCEATANFTGVDQLMAGDFSNRTCEDGTPCDDDGDCTVGVCTEWVWQDNLVDIQDFSILFIYWNLPVDANVNTWADVNGDGFHDVADFSAIQANFAEVGDQCGSFSSVPDYPSSQFRTQILVSDLHIRGARRADRNSDGVVNTKDIRQFAKEKNLELTREFERKLEIIERAEEEAFERLDEVSRESLDRSMFSVSTSTHERR